MNIERAFFGNSVEYAHQILAECNLSAESITFPYNEGNHVTYKIAVIKGIDISKLTEEQYAKARDCMQWEATTEDIVKHIISKQIHSKRR